MRTVRAGWPNKGLTKLQSVAQGTSAALLPFIGVLLLCHYCISTAPARARIQGGPGNKSVVPVLCLKSLN
eukprot:1158677-Pelagomonas_calceolata.AAC.11